jgi:hypothetical protein
MCLALRPLKGVRISSSHLQRMAHLAYWYMTLKLFMANGFQQARLRAEGSTLLI